MIVSRVGVSAAALVVVGLIAGCGSSGSTSSSAAASSPSATSTSKASGYGSAGASTTSAAASTTSAAAPAGTPVVLTTKHSKVGTILAAGSKRMTVYLFEADKGPQSSCTGACAGVWPPVTGKASAVGGAQAADLGTLKRADGSTQVTYKGHPLYYFVKDKDGGDAYGQGSKAFGAGWYVLRPSGSKVDQS